MVDAMFDSRSLFLRSKDVKKCSGKTPGASKNFWGAVTGKVKQSSDISAVLSSSGVLKCGNDEICAEVETHLCDVFQGSMESLSTPLPPGNVHVDHSYSSVIGPADPRFEHNYSLMLESLMILNGILVIGWQETFLRRN